MKKNLITRKTKHAEPETVRKLLNPLVEKWFFSRFKSFSLPQLFAVNEIHARNNILVSAPTGATKTLTGFLSVLNELVDSSQKGILKDKTYCIYISPLKALNEDIRVNLQVPLEEMEKIAEKELGIRVAVRTGDTTQKEKSAMLKTPPHILITTPESLAILLSSVKFVEHIKDVEWCIIDEIHALAENKRGVHLSLSLERLSNFASHMTRVGLSATVAPLEEIAKFLVGSKRECKLVDVQFIKQLDLKVMSPVPKIMESTHEAMHHEMYKLINELIQSHKTTLIFTNTRAATERVVHYLREKFPKDYTENIGAHHGSLSKEHRHNIENNLREGKLKCVVCSTSLELGIDIGYIDLVICLGSPKSVARALQRIGRSGHRLKEVTKGRIIVLDRDDLIECSVLLKSAIEKKIDRIHIPKNCLDVLAQQIDGMAIEQVWDEKELFNTIKKSYCYHDLKWADYNEILEYLSGKFVSLEDRHIYAKIWRNEGKIGRRGRLGRVIYMTNIGTIPDESFVTVKIGNDVVGKIDESFLERLKPGDVFLLGGSVYQFKFSRGQVAQVSASVQRPPTVPSWSSEMLPLSYDLARDIGKFRRLMLEKFNTKKKKSDIIQFLYDYLYVDKNAANAVYEYFREQYDYVKKFGTDKTLLVEHYTSEDENKVVFHSMFGRRVNDCLSRAVAFAIARTEHKNVEIGMNDNGFYVDAGQKVNVMKAFKLLRSDKLDLLLGLAIEKSEVYKRRFRHCATRSLMILRNYLGRQKRVGRQQVSSMILMKALQRINPDFSILKEARREVLEDLMDIGRTKEVLQDIESGKMKIEEISTNIPSPFAFKTAFQGYIDILKIEDKMEFLKRMHQMVMAKIALQKGKNPDEGYEDFDYYKEFKKEAEKRLEEKQTKEAELKMMAWNLDKVPMYAKEEIVKLIDGDKEIRKDVIDSIFKYKERIMEEWPEELRKFVFKRIKEIR